jgi:DNA-directed RNA polymerase specialized sigma24 family protein
MRRRSKSTVGDSDAHENDLDAVGLEIGTQRIRQKQTRLTTEDSELLVAAYLSGLTLDELAQAFNVHPATAANHLKRRNVNRRGRRLTNDDVAAIEAAYKKGLSLAQIGRQFAVTPTTINYWLRKQGVALRPRTGNTL